MRHKNENLKYKPAPLGYILALLTAVSVPIHAQTGMTDTNKLEQENADLRPSIGLGGRPFWRRKGLHPAQAEPPPRRSRRFSDITISGFVTASYFYDVASSKDNHPTGYLWNTAMNQFTLNKAQVDAGRSGFGQGQMERNL